MAGPQERVFEVYRRDGHGKVKLFESSELEEIAELAAAKSGVRLPRLATDGGGTDGDS